MKFMNNVEDGNINLEEGKLTEQEAQAWADEYFNVDASTSEKKTPETVSESWANEFLKTNGK